jgi:1-phosphatidylinositol phosphodiesterase
MEKRQRKHLIIATSISSIVFLGTVFSVLAFPKADGSASDWMGKVQDSAALTSLSIPGSHDSAAFHSLADVAGKCQDASIAEQLSYGVRFFDVRLRNEDNSLLVYHGFVNQGMTFSTLLSPIYSFLKDHPKECLLLSAKKEQDDKGSSKSFEAVLKETIEANPSYWVIDAALPETIGAVRGKIVLLSRYDSPTIGIDASAPSGWLDPKEASSANTFTIDKATKIRVQDHYKLLDNQTKWSEAIALLSEAASSTEPKTLYLNFFSGYLTKGLPPSYSLTTAKVINPQILKELPASHKGILIVDFATKDLVKKLLEGNPA